LYQPADRFVNEFINAIRFDKAHQFQAKYRDVDVLLIDDVQFIANKDQTQEAFFHIFNTLYDAHKQIVFSSDTYPQNLNGIAERLRSRLEWGLVADIQLPNLETKMEILKKKAIFHGVSLQDDVAHFLASRVVANVRALEGSLVHVMAVASLTKQPVTVDLAKKILVRSNHGVAPGSLDFDRIVKHVCDHYSLTITDLRSHNRAKELSLARQVAMYLMKKMTNKSLHEIGFFLGRKDHSRSYMLSIKYRRL
jgi:chromosomal replication initiator protein